MQVTHAVAQCVQEAHAVHAVAASAEHTDILDRTALSSWSDTVHQGDLATHAMHPGSALADWLCRQSAVYAGGLAQTTEPTSG